MVIDGTVARWKRKSYPHVEFHVEDDPSSFRESIAMPLVNELISGLEARFGDRSLLDAFKIFDPSEYRGLPYGDLDVFFYDQLEVLKEHFWGSSEPTLGSIFPERGPELDIILKHQFGVMRERLWREANALKGASFEVIWKRVAPGLMAVAPLLLRLLYVCVVIICHTASVERGFSLHQQIKSVKASRLRVLTVDALMRVKLLSPGLEETEAFDKLSEEAVTLLSNGEESFFQQGQPPSMMRKLNEEVNGIMEPLVATTVLGASQHLVGEPVPLPPVEFEDFSDLAELGIILVPDMDEADFEAAPLFDLNDAPFDMVEKALANAAVVVAAAVLHLRG